MNLDAGLPIHLLVDAARRASEADNRPFMIRQKGDPDRGSLFVLVTNRLGDAESYRQTRDGEGKVAWMQRKLTRDQVEAEVAKAIEGDLDCWVIEIEREDGLMPFEGQCFHF